MQILVAEDDPVTAKILERLLRDWGYQPELVADGLAALEALSRPNAPKLAILDWMMPGLEGPQICTAVRSRNELDPPYLMILTSKDREEDIVAGLWSGADDYITKPFDYAELRARIQVGERVVKLQQQLNERVEALESALHRIRRLETSLASARLGCPLPAQSFFSVEGQKN